MNFIKTKLNLKKTFVLLMTFVLISSSFFTYPVFANNSDTISHVLSSLEKYVASQAQAQQNTNSKILLITVRNINLENDQCQTIHDTLQNKFPNQNIVDIYINDFGTITIPEQKIPVLQDNQNQYDQQDMDFISNLNTVNIKNISIINQQENFKVPQSAHYNIISSTYNIYKLLMELTDKYINHVTNPLVTSFEVRKVDTNLHAVGEFVSFPNSKIVLSPQLFKNPFEKSTNLNSQNSNQHLYIKTNSIGIPYATNNLTIQQQIDKNITYTVWHEFSHSVEFALTKKVFDDIRKDLRLKISPKNMETLASVYFSGGHSVIGSSIQKNLLSKMNVPNNISDQKKFIEENITSYANTNPSEFFAELFAFGRFKFENQSENQSKTKELFDFAKQEVKNMISGQGDTYETTKNSILNFLRENRIISDKTMY